LRLPGELPRKNKLKTTSKTPAGKEKEGGRYTFKDNIKSKEAGGPPALRIQLQRQRLAV
jgi:hypothetical protein